MYIEADPKWMSSLQPSALNSIRKISERTTRGSDEALESPIFEQISDDDAVKAIEDILGNVSLTPKLRDIENSNLLKLGPRSIQKPYSERRGGILSYFNYDEPKVDLSSGTFSDEFVGAILDTLSKYQHPHYLNRLGGLRPASFKTIQDNLIRSSNSGLPQMTRKGNLLPLDEDEQFEDLGKFPFFLFTRTQEQGKTRPVFGAPLALTIFESMYAIPFMKFEKGLPWRAALLGEDAVAEKITAILRNPETAKMPKVSVDFSAYDTSVTPSLSHASFATIASQFSKDHYQGIYNLWHLFATLGIYTPEGEISGWHGVPSGSTFTNTVDSMAQLLVASHLGLEQVQGDDGLYVYHNPGEIYETFHRNGFEINEDKSEESVSEVSYLQRYYHPHYRHISRYDLLGGVYSLYRAYNRIRYIERWTNFEREGISGSDYFALRTLMILENCKHHPGFEKFAKWVQSHDRNGLRYSHGSAVSFSNMMQSKARAGVFNSKITGIKGFEVSKLLFGT
jgi:hypothetical protein